MSKSSLAPKRIRKNFGKIKQIVGIPDLIGMQRESFQRLLQMDIPPEKREEIGLQTVFKSVFPIKDFTGSASLEFVAYRFGDVKHGIEECIHRGMTYEIPVRITARLVVYDIDTETGVSNIRDIKEQEIYFGTIPLMTDKGTFIINGTERVVVSQLHRSSGVFFDHDKGKSHSSGKIIYSSRIIPVRGSWIDMEIDPKDIVYIRIDRRRKFPATILFKAFGYTVEDLLAYFYQTEKIIVKGKRYFKKFDENFLKGQRASKDVKDPETGDVLVKTGRIFSQRAIKRLQAANAELIPIHASEVIYRAFAATILHPQSEEIIAKAVDTVDDEILTELSEAGVNEFELLFIDGYTAGESIRKTLLMDKVETKEEALIEIYRRLRPGNPATPEVAQDFVDNLFFKSTYYDLSGVGRLKINQRLGISSEINLNILRKEDILLTCKALIELRDTQGVVDDIDHLGNRRVRAVGELLENQYRIGLVRIERAIKERMSLQEVDALMPHDLVNPKPVSAVVKEFFGTSQLSQFMDQTNPLSETTHKRRLSALGPGGLTRERAGFEVRDVHPSHYGRICPIETPEGPNIGLIVSLSTYARVNDYGFIETPYRKVENSTVTDEVQYMSATEEMRHTVAQANANLDGEGKFVNEMVNTRQSGEYTLAPRENLILATGSRQASLIGLEATHGDVSLGLLFRPVWYEGYAEPQHMWQSSSATDDFEPKLGLMPLIFGTIKATFYSMLFGAPLALLAAIFSSEFLHPKARANVKPTIELMASLPSVVLGFLAALVMAPIVERVVVEFLAVLLLAPFFLLLAAHDTTTSALTMACYYLAHDQEWQDRLREEISALGRPEMSNDSADFAPEDPAITASEITFAPPSITEGKTSRCEREYTRRNSACEISPCQR